jgi:hypothetical protein
MAGGAGHFCSWAGNECRQLGVGIASANPLNQFANAPLWANFAAKLPLPDQQEDDEWQQQMWRPGVLWLLSEVWSDHRDDSAVQPDPDDEQEDGADESINGGRGG